MNFNFKEILEMFSGHWKFIAFLILVTASLTGFVVVPVAQSYFGSERQSCGKCLDENDRLLTRIIEISALVREYEYMKAKEREINREVLTEMAIDTQQPHTYMRMAVDQNEIINTNKDSIISRIDKLTAIE